LTHIAHYVAHSLLLVSIAIFTNIEVILYSAQLRACRLLAAMKVALRIYAAIFTPLIIQGMSIPPMFSKQQSVTKSTPAVLANECFLNSTPTSSLNNSILIQSQSDADSQLQGCTTVLGSIEIAQNYTGALSLPSVANITGKILQENGSNTPYITSIQLENLIYIDSVRIDSAAALESISFPELSSATTLSFNGNSGPKIDCPSLVTASHINIIGLGFEYVCIQNKKTSTLLTE
jgi:hypothetical protein